MKKNKKGFTLIELLVVISIISLLSSVVMAGMTSARNKAKQNAFRSEVMQFVNALELYRNDHADYPFEDNGMVTDSFTYIIYNNNTHNQTNGYPDFATEMGKYMRTFPNPRGNDGGLAFQYWSNNVSTDWKYRCKGSLKTPEYVIITRSSVFADWPQAQYEEDNSGIFSDVMGTYCFSLN